MQTTMAVILTNMTYGPMYPLCHENFLFKWVVQAGNIVISCVLGRQTQFKCKYGRVNANRGLIIQKTSDMLRKHMQTIIVKNIEKNQLLLKVFTGINILPPSPPKSMLKWCNFEDCVHV